ncbi:MAG TPA: TetR/AcrR family transcriptional regulator [Spirochaetales bacterium]|nr:TetR/AcrR family transcriptional regulator [Spirochaetales bacterium]
MSLKKQKRLEKKKALILEEAKKVLIKFGKNASMADIADNLDMDKSSLYYYYKGIPEILNIILDQEYYEIAVEIDHLRHSGKNHRAVIKDFICDILEFYYDNIEILQIILTRVFPLFIDPENREDSAAINKYMDSYRRNNEFFLEEIKAAIHKDEMHSDFSAEMVLQVLRGSIFGICAAWKTGKPSRESIPELSSLLLSMFLYAEDKR